MARVIINRRVTNDAWLRLDAAAADTVDLTEFDAARGDFLVPLASWQARRSAWQARPGRTGVWLAPTDDPSAVHDAHDLALVAVHFPAYADGRGYSLAFQLRRDGYAGELRAIGAIGRDQFIELERTGFDAIEVRAGEDSDELIRGFDALGKACRANARAPEPPVRRRIGAT